MWISTALTAAHAILWHAMYWEKLSGDTSCAMLGAASGGWNEKLKVFKH